MALTPGKVIVATKSQVSCQLEGEAVILHLDQGVYFGLNEVGTTIWEFIQQPRTVDDVRRRVLEEYDVTPEQCERELTGFVESLAGAGLITVSDATPS